MMSQMALPPRQLIDSVRRSFLVDDDVPEEFKEGALNLQTQLNSALTLLSEDLYSKKSHFVLELIQNADDNRYPEDTTPELSFRIEPNLLIVSNNEVGFNDENVKAICKVGASTKAQNKERHIGEKGIGFKSVFSVSNAPEIHSNGFHFRFDRTVPTNLLGYVIPTWCDSSAFEQHGYTSIVLPAAPGYIFSDSTVSELDSRVLLFLNKLRQLTVIQGGVQLTFRRSDEAGFSRLTTSAIKPGGTLNDAKLDYLRVAKTFSMEGEWADSKRPRVIQSTVVLAFPIGDDGSAMAEPGSYAFAYLPVLQVGFKFPLHADFILNSGREGVLNDRPWNQRLRDCIAETFLLALNDFKKSSTLALTYLKYIPDATDIADEFFGKFRSAVVKGLSVEESLLSSSGAWHRPVSLRFADKGFRKLFPSPVARTLFGFDYIDTRIQGGSSLLRELGVRDAGHSEILDIFRLHQDWLKEQPLKWRGKLYAFIADNLPAFMSAGILDVPCVPTSEGAYFAASQTKVFFPLGRGKKYGFEHELVILDSELYDAALEQSNEVPQLFVALKVSGDRPYDLVVSHILHKHAGEAWKKSKSQALIGHMRYVKDKLNDFLEEALSYGKSQTQAFQMLREGMWIGTKLKDEDGTWRFNRVGNLYLGKEFTPSFCIETLTSGEPGPESYVSADYLSSKAKDPEADIRSWLEFFTALGVRVSPAVESSGADWTCSSELRLLLESTNSRVRRETLECLSLHWHSYSSKMSRTISLGWNRTTPGTSTFSRQLKEMSAPLRSRKNPTRLSESYYFSEELYAILGDGLPYVDANLSTHMLEDCGIAYRMNAESLIKRLKQLKQSGHATNKQVQTIYRVLGDRLWEGHSNQIRQAFENDELIHLRGQFKEWFSPEEIVWQSSSPFLDSLYPSVQGMYRDYQGFLIDKLHVPRSLSIFKRVEALTRLESITERSARETEALAIYKRAEFALRPQFGKEIALPEWIDIFRSESVFVDHWGNVVSNSDCLFADDSNALAELFEDELELSFLAVPSTEVPGLSRLLTATNVARLSEAISVKVAESVTGKVDADLTSRLLRAIPYFARVIYSRVPTAFDSALEEGKLSALWNVAVTEVPSVNLMVTLGKFSRETTTELAMANGAILYRSHAKSLKDRIAVEISKHLVGNVTFADTFARILLEENEEAIEEFLNVGGIGQLPLDKEQAIRQRELSTEQVNHGAEDENSYVPTDEETEESSGIATSDNSDEVTLADSESDELSMATSVSIAAEKTDLPQPLEVAPAPIKVVKAVSLDLSPAQTASPSPPSSPHTCAPSLGTPTSHINQPSSVVLVPRSSPTASPDKEADGSSTHGSSPSFTRPIGPAPLSFNPIGTPLTKERPSVPVLRVAGLFPKRSARRTTQRTKSGRLLSYVERADAPDATMASEDPSKAIARDGVSRAAVAYFLKTQAHRWISLTEMPHNNPGFDVLALNAAGDEEYIEVKGQGGAWTHEGVALTPTELLTAHRMKDRYWLCVVEFAQDEKRRLLHLLQDPFGKANQFRFDVGWKSAADSVSSSPLLPEKGLYILVAANSYGRIISVRSKGKFYQLHILLKDGKQLNCLFNPSKMSLSKESLWQE